MMGLKESIQTDKLCYAIMTYNCIKNFARDK